MSRPETSGPRAALPAVLLALLVSLAVAAPATAADPFLRRTPTVQAVERVGPAVVSITSARLAQGNPFRALGEDPIYERFLRDFTGPRRLPTETDVELGSGVIIDPDGHVLTNEHVISRATQIRVKLADGRSFEASVVGADPNNDLAVVRIETDEKLPWVAPGSSDDLLVGEPVIAIGNPFGLSNTVTTGVISAVDRSFYTPQQSFHGFIQTDASINPGNSGGPLLNAEGSLVGINSAIYGDGQGIGFAIPIDVAKKIVSELIDHGEVTPIWVGAEFRDLDPGLHEVLRVPLEQRGVLVTRVRDNSPSQRAGLQAGDVLLRADGRDLAGAQDLFDFLETALVDQEIAVDLWRDGKSRQITLRTEQIPPEHVRALTQERLGLELAELPGPEGFEITQVEPDSPAGQIGFRSGDRLIAVNGRRLGGNDDLRRAIVELRGRRRAVVVVQRGAGRYHVTIPLA